MAFPANIVITSFGGEGGEAFTPVSFRLGKDSHGQVFSWIAPANYQDIRIIKYIDYYTYI